MESSYQANHFTKCFKCIWNFFEKKIANLTLFQGSPKILPRATFRTKSIDGLKIRSTWPTTARGGTCFRNHFLLCTINKSWEGLKMRCPNPYMCHTQLQGFAQAISKVVMRRFPIHCHTWQKRHRFCILHKWLPLAPISLFHSSSIHPHKVAITEGDERFPFCKDETRLYAQF